MMIRLVRPVALGAAVVFLSMVCAPAALAADGATIPAPPPRGTTSELGDLAPVVDAGNEASRTVAAPWSPASSASLVVPATPLAPRARVTDPAWSLVAEQPVFFRLGKGQRYAVRFDATTEALVLVTPADALTALARQAVNRAPTWLQKPLEDQFAKMTTAQQDKWAQKVVNAADPYVDETAFLVAHVARQDLASTSFYDALIQDMATYAYEVDPYLDYVEVVDHGSAATGGDYYTTLRYQVDLDGTRESFEIPRETYYWYVIHPRTSDEFPTYIDPTQCNSGGTPAAPPTGKFWARWFFFGATNKNGGQCNGSPCPVMKNMLAGVQTLWAHLDNTSGPTNGAVGQINEWVRQSIGPFGDRDGCRPVEPVVVYYWTDGNCGEWADLTAAAGRAALIPTDNTETRVNDHVWNYFFDPQWNRWVQWEPVNNMINSDYSGWWGGKIAANNTYRGDGYGHGERTRMNGPYATLVVTVYDKNHYPVDGAEVFLGSEYDALPMLIQTATKGHTDAAGQTTFYVGDSRNYYVYVNTTWGRYPASGWTQVIANAAGGTRYDWSPPNFTGAVPRLSVSSATSSGTLDNHLIEVRASVPEGYVHGTSIVSSISYTKDWPGNLDHFILDQANWTLFTSDTAFQGFGVALDSAGQDWTFIPPDPGDYYVAWSNKATLDMTHVLTGTVRLYRNTGAVPPVGQLTVGTDALRASVLDWEDVAGQNVDGYNVYRSLRAEDVGDAQGESQLAPYLLAFVAGSQYTDPAPAPAGSCLFYTVRTHSKRGGISP